MRFTTPAAIGATLLLAACGKGGSDVALKDASVDQVASAQANRLQPGEWEVTMEVTKQDMKGGNPALGPMPKVPPTTAKVCITPEQASRPEAMFGSKGMEQFQKSCTYDHFTMAHGRMDAAMHCDIPNGPTVKNVITGTFSDTDMATDGTSEVAMPGGMTITSATKMTAHRTGDCQPGDAKAN